MRLLACFKERDGLLFRPQAHLVEFYGYVVRHQIGLDVLQLGEGEWHCVASVEECVGEQLRDAQAVAAKVQARDSGVVRALSKMFGRV